MRKTKIIALSAIIVISIFVVLSGLMISPMIVTREPQMDIFAKNTYSETIRVVADENYPPFSFKGENGDMIGCDIEILNALANEMKVNIDIKFMSWPEALQSIKNGDADIILGLEYNKEYSGLYNLSSPVAINQYVAFGKEDYKTVHCLYTKKVGILNYSTAKELFVDAMALENVKTYEHYEDAFKDIQDGKLDYLIARYSVGNRVLNQEKITDVKAVGNVLVSNAFCFGVQKDNNELLMKLDNAIIKCINNNSISEISNKWLGDYIGSVSLQQFLLKYITHISVVLILIILLCTLAISQLLKHKNKSQKDLYTGIYNKKATEHLIRKDIAYRNKGAMLIVDIDNLKYINDNYGHIVGDEFILQISNILKNIFKNNSIVGRVGGDEFMIFVKGQCVQDVISKKAHLVQSKLKEYIVATNNKNVTVSIGVTLSNSIKDFVDLYSKTDKQLYKAKSLGKNIICITSPEDLELDEEIEI